MNKLLKYSALAVFVGAGMGVAHADEATTTGGIKIKSSDGNFDASIGGRIHFDGEIISPDSSLFNSGTGDTKSSFFFRRVFLSLAGHLYGFEYHIDEDLSATSNPGNGFNDVWLAHAVFGSDTLYVGQHKPWRSMDELSSNNIIPFMERNILSANGLYLGRDFTDGVFYKWTHGFTGHDNFFAGASVYTLNKLGTSGSAPTCTATSTVTGGTAGTTVTTTCTVSGAGSAVAPQTHGTGYNARLAYAPFVSADSWLHFGAAYTSDNAATGGYGALSSGYSTYYGKQGSSATLVTYGAVPAGAGGNPHVDVVHGEIAGAYGPLFVEGEAGNAAYHQQNKHADNVNAYSISALWTVTGETRPYDKGVASYGAIKPKHAYGAVELGVRYDFEKDTGTFGGGCASVKAKAGSAFPGAINKCDVSAITAGVTYYPNPAVRFMLNYEHGDFDLGAAGKDQPDAVMARAQVAF